MNNRARYFLALICTLMIPVTVFGGVPLIENCDIFTRATEDVSVFLCPACDGYGLFEAQTFGGDLMDATIEVYIRDGLGQGVPGVDRFTIWIDDPALCWCDPEGNVADFDTLEDPAGYTEFSLAPCGGGCSSPAALGGYLAGEPFLQNNLPHFNFNSADMNCDLVVDLIDLAQFTPAYFGAYTYCVDYHWDGVINLVDLALFSQHYGHACP